MDTIPIPLIQSISDPPDSYGQYTLILQKMQDISVYFSSKSTLWKKIFRYTADTVRLSRSFLRGSPDSPLTFPGNPLY